MSGAGKNSAALLWSASVVICFPCPGWQSYQPGRHHVNRFRSERRWTNEPDGTLVASSSNQKYGGAIPVSTSSPGKWYINDAGKYCIEIDWKRELEKWCASIVKATDGTLYLNSVESDRKIEFAK